MNSEVPPSPIEPAVLPHSDASVVLVSENTGDVPDGNGDFPFHIPPILLEGDDSETDAIAEDAQKFSPGAEVPEEKIQAEGALPKSYGTEKLLLTARDPHWLYAHWDLSEQQEREHRAQSADNHLRLRVFQNNLSGTPVNEVQVQPDARHWFVHVERAASNYVAQLGYKKSGGEWTTISSSAPTATPPDAMSLNTNAQFATIPIETPMEKLKSFAQSEATANLPLAQAIEKLRATGHSELPPMPMLAPWTPEQTAALAQLSGIAQIAAISSLEISSHAAPQFPAPSSVEISSPAIAPPAQKKFWFNINAELVIYGSTESDATVTISGKNIELRPDGSFTLRFALPDGEFELPVVAVSADQTDGRSAELKFTRATQIRGDVGAHSQGPSLKAPGNF